MTDLEKLIDKVQAASSESEVVFYGTKEMIEKIDHLISKDVRRCVLPNVVDKKKHDCDGIPDDEWKKIV